MTLSYCGIGVATTRAIAIGPAFLLDRSPLTVPPRSIDPAAVPGELRRFEDCLLYTSDAADE